MGMRRTCAPSGNPGLVRRQHIGGACDVRHHDYDEQNRRIYVPINHPTMPGHESRDGRRFNTTIPVLTA